MVVANNIKPWLISSCQDLSAKPQPSTLKRSSSTSRHEDRNWACPWPHATQGLLTSCGIVGCFCELGVQCLGLCRLRALLFGVSILGSIVLENSHMDYIVSPNLEIQ